MAKRCDELSSIRYDDGEDNKGVMKVESKKDMRLRNIASPNIADALCILTISFTLWRGGL